MSRQTATLFDDPSPRGEESLLLDDLMTLVTLGLIEPSEDGSVLALTPLGRALPEFAGD
jgi:hypothetical protein